MNPITHSSWSMQSLETLLKYLKILSMITSSVMLKCSCRNCRNFLLSIFDLKLWVFYKDYCFIIMISLGFIPWFDDNNLIVLISPFLKNSFSSVETRSSSYDFDLFDWVMNPKILALLLVLAITIFPLSLTNSTDKK